MTAAEASRRPSRWRRVRIAVCLLVLIASFLMPAAWIEAWFSDAWFRFLQGWLVPAAGAIGIPITGCALVLLPVVLGFRSWLGWRRLGLEGVGRWRRVGRGSLALLRSALYLYVAFLLVWGFGYRRTPLEQRWGIEDRRAPRTEVLEVQRRLIALMRRDYVAVADRDRERAWRSIEAAQSELVAKLEGYRPAYPGSVKSPPTGWLMAFDVAGCVSPFLLEAHVDSALADPQWLSVCGHELAHLVGYCGEAEANLVGFLSGLQADDPLARYSTALRLYFYAGGAAKDLPRGAQEDLAVARRIRKQHLVQTLKDLSGAIYERYLRSQGVKAGMKDYSRGFRLFMGAWAKGLVSLPAD